MEPEPISPVPPHDPGRTVFSQGWREVAFLHWAVEPGVVAPLLPPGTRPDVLDGTTYVGLLGFQGVRAGVLGSRGLPYLGTFAEVWRYLRGRPLPRHLTASQLLATVMITDYQRAPGERPGRDAGEKRVAGTRPSRTMHQEAEVRRRPAGLPTC